MKFAAPDSAPANSHTCRLGWEALLILCLGFWGGPVHRQELIDYNSSVTYYLLVRPLQQGLFTDQYQNTGANNFYQHSQYMRIKRTLPSLLNQGDWHEANRLSLRNQKAPIVYEHFPITHHFEAGLTTISKGSPEHKDLKEGSKSPHRPIFGSKQKSPADKLNSLNNSSLKKNVTFASLEMAQKNITKPATPATNRSHRQPIFSSKQKKSISVRLNVTDMSNKLKNSRQDSNDKLILQKIENLQGIIQKIEKKVTSGEKAEAASRNRAISQFHLELKSQQPVASIQRENHLLKLQLEQIQRCEHIAKENQELYRFLAKGIERHETVLIAQLKHSRNTNSRADTAMRSTAQKAKKIDNFEDFHQQELRIPKSLEDGEITSPFEIEENRARINHGSFQKHN